MFAQACVFLLFVGAVLCVRRFGQIAVPLFFVLTEGGECAAKTALSDLFAERRSVRAQAQGKTLTINIGFSHPVILDAPENITFETPEQTKIVIKGVNKQQVGNLAADIRAIRKPEPYLGKGIKYEDEVIRRKEGKTGK